MKNPNYVVCWAALHEFSLITCATQGEVLQTMRRALTAEFMPHLGAQRQTCS